MMASLGTSARKTIAMISSSSLLSMTLTYGRPKGQVNLKELAQAVVISLSGPTWQVDQAQYNACQL